MFSSHLAIYTLGITHTNAGADYLFYICPNSVNFVVRPSEVIPTAIATAQQIIANSPDAVQSTKHGLLLAQKHNVSEAMLTHTWSPYSKQVYKGANIKVRLSSN
jgi:hypothetical protein